MADVKSQSRYGIMEELNNKKIVAKERLAELERTTDNELYTNETKMESVERNIKAKEASYKPDFKQWKREQEVALRQLKQELDREIKQMEATIKGEETTYEAKFQDWKIEQERLLKTTKQNLKLYQDVQTKKIATQKEIIAEITQGIEDLKDMSNQEPK